MAVETVEIDVEVKHETTNAVLINSAGVETWIPRSMIKDYCEEDGIMTSIFIPQWLAEEKDLV